VWARPLPQQVVVGVVVVAIRRDLDQARIVQEDPAPFVGAIRARLPAAEYGRNDEAALTPEIQDVAVSQGEEFLAIRSVGRRHGHQSSASDVDERCHPLGASSDDLTAEPRVEAGPSTADDVRPNGSVPRNGGWPTRGGDNTAELFDLDAALHDVRSVFTQLLPDLGRAVLTEPDLLTLAAEDLFRNERFPWESRPPVVHVPGRWQVI